MSGGNNQGEPAIVLLMTIALFTGMCWLLWTLTREYWLDYGFRWLRFGELWVINLFTGKLTPCLEWLKHAQVDAAQPTPLMAGWTRACFSPAFLARLPADELPYYYQLSIPPLSAMGTVVTTFYRWPIAIALAWVVFQEMMFSPRTKFMTRHTLESFIEVQAKMWPIITPILKFNPSKSGRLLGDPVPEKLPIFAEALSPEEWITWSRIPMQNGVVDDAAARRAFVQQLGPRWTGVEATPIHYQALFAAFTLRGMQKRDESEKMLGDIALCWSPEKGLRLTSELIAQIKKVNKDAELGGKATLIADQHAWRTTALLAVLKWARTQGGVLPPAQFLWLRAEDRALWYPLNNLGRRSFHSEGAGALAHFMAEEAAKKPLPIPRVETAIVTINTYLHDPDKRPIPIPSLKSDAKA